MAAERESQGFPQTPKELVDMVYKAVPMNEAERQYSVEVIDGLLYVDGPQEIQHEVDAYLDSLYQAIPLQNKPAHRHDLSCRSLIMLPHDARDRSAMFAEWAANTDESEYVCAFPLPPYYPVGECAVAEEETQAPPATYSQEELLALMEERADSDPWWEIAEIEVGTGYIFVRGPSCLHEELDLYIEELRTLPKQSPQGQAD